MKVMRLSFLFIALILFVSIPIFSAELNNLSFLPALNSSTIVNDSKASFINPAGLYHIENLNFEFSSYNLGISYLSLSIPTANFLGIFSFGLYNFSREVEQPVAGYFAASGNNFWNVLALGVSFKTLSSSVYNPIDGFYFDAGMIFHPNASLGLDFLKNEFLNDKIFISFAVKNIGVASRTTTPEPLSLRLGAAYDLTIIGTKLFVEKSFLSDSDVFVAGLEFSPILRFISEEKFFKIGGSYDFEQQDIKLSGTIIIYNLNFNISYSFKSSFLFFGASSSFGKGKIEMSEELYKKALENYQNALTIEKSDIEESFNLYQSANEDLKKAISLNPENKKVILLKDSIDDKIENYKSNFRNLAESEEKKGNLLNALMYYKKLYFIEKNDKLVIEKISTLSTNKSLKRSIEIEKKNIKSLYNKKKYLSAKRKMDYLSNVIPEDSELKTLKSQLEYILNEIAKKYYEQANLQYKKGNYTACIDNARKALTYKPNFSEARELYSLAVNQVSKKKGLERAKEEFDKQNYIQALKIIDAYLVKNPQNKEAITLRNNTLEKLREGLKDMLDRGILYYNNGDYERAVAELDKVLLVDSTNSIASDYRSRAISKLKALKKLEEFEEE